MLILLAAAATDWADGFYARRRSEVTTLGILLDPIADKLLMSAAFISLVEMHLVQGWMAVIIIGREIVVLGLRNIASAEGFTIPASALGKTKMVLQGDRRVRGDPGAAKHSDPYGRLACCAPVADGGQRGGFGGHSIFKVLGPGRRQREAAASPENSGTAQER